MPARPDSKPARPPREPVREPADDGTRQLLKGGAWIVGTGVLAGVLLQTVFGGYSHTGANTNAGWFALIVVLMNIPFGGLLLGLGIAKWFRNRRIARGRQ